MALKKGLKLKQSLKLKTTKTKLQRQMRALKARRTRIAKKKSNTS